MDDKQLSLLLHEIKEASQRIAASNIAAALVIAQGPKEGPAMTQAVENYKSIYKHALSRVKTV